jgi:predicted dehydrogenase
VARRIELGDIGEPLQLVVRCGGVRRPEGWAADREKLGGGVFMDIGVHFVRAMRLLMGEPDSAFASRPMQMNTRMSGEDSLNVLFESRYGWQAHLLATWAHPWGIGPDIIVAGEKGTFHLWPDKTYVEFYPMAARPLTKLVSYVRPFWLRERLMRPELQRVRMRIPGPGLSGYVAEFREFLSAVAENRAPTTAAMDGRRDLEIVLRAYESLESGRPVEISPVSGAAEIGRSR